MFCPVVRALTAISEVHLCCALLSYFRAALSKCCGTRQLESSPWQLASNARQRFGWRVMHGSW